MRSRSFINSTSQSSWFKVVTVAHNPNEAVGRLLICKLCVNIVCEDDPEGKIIGFGNVVKEDRTITVNMVSFGVLVTCMLAQIAHTNSNVKTQIITIPQHKKKSACCVST